eukprot:TRINITY_DN1165_c0_g1::TRINITY_DN1165_c0_g1_i1::g.17223::m.17223 TRINITY_DN1165_c0_g1::TRINITY_DN1165_c0_g1_i1::g.17223  ORF type:complete len:685 (+),score=131.30,sp/Q9LFU5/TRM1_ARATH/40.10/2e-133,TRM/PF02005.11/1.6e-118,zf-CCCH/PF00642.19/0.0046,MTS/PF05175.9/0.24 TRINITY_DN1165_c0_g1_i1:23-2056(+)
MEPKKSIPERTNFLGPVPEPHKPVPEGFKGVTEGKATILFSSDEEVFYNKAQVVNRDLTIIMMRLFIEDRERELRERFEEKKAKVIRDIEKLKEKGIDPSTKKGLPLDIVDQSFQFPGISIFDGLSASGLRTLRFSKEVQGIRRIVANDIETSAVEVIKRNLEFNDLRYTEVEARDIASTAMMKSTDSSQPHICVTREDAIVSMILSRPPHCQFDIVDLDPYGSASMFLDSAVQCVADGGLLCVTCTDMAVLCGNHPEVSFAKYGGTALKGESCHEFGLRLLLHTIEAHANKYKRHIVPLLSLSIDFYCRVFVRVYTSAAAVKLSPSKFSYVYQCVGCENQIVQPVQRATPITRDKPAPPKDGQEGGQDVMEAAQGEPQGEVQGKAPAPETIPHMYRYQPGSGPAAPMKCPECSSRFVMGGPIWMGPIHDHQLVSRALDRLKAESSVYQAHKKMLAMLTTVSEELPDAPFYVSLSRMCGVCKAVTPPIHAVQAYLKKIGYRTSPTHCTPSSFKTDAPWSTLWDILRAWIKLHPVKKVEAGTPAEHILAKEVNEALLPEVTFDAPKSSSSTTEKKDKKDKVARFLPNPEDNWGPKRAARGSKRKADDAQDTAQQQPAAHAQKRSRPCFHFVSKGQCAYGDQCLFMHTTTTEAELGTSSAGQTPTSATENCDHQGASDQ